MLITKITRFYCPKCGYDQLIKKGFTPDGRQRFRCLECNKTSTYKVRSMGSSLFNPKKLLPFMFKSYQKLNKQELYSLGLLIANGSLSKANQMSITLQKDDGYILNYVKEALAIPNPVGLVVCGNKKKEYARLTWGYKYAEPYWKEYGLIKCKTKHEFWLTYMNSFHFLRGYLDGNGCISKDRLIFSCGALRFLQSLQEWLSNFFVDLGYLYKGHGCYTLEYRHKTSAKILELIYQDSLNLRLEKKYNKYLERIQTIGEAKLLPLSFS